MSYSAPERPRARPSAIPDDHDDFEDADDLDSYDRTLETTMAKADQLIAADAAGTLTPRQKAELPRVTMKLRKLLRAQLKSNGKVAREDWADGSYDNEPVDRQLRQQLAAVRNMDFSHNKLWGTRTYRKVKSWLFEDIPNWLNTTSWWAYDTVKHYLPYLAVAGTVGGYMLAGSLTGVGALGGLQLLGSHLGTLGGAVVSGVGGLINLIRGKRPA